ncbi:hypothetical protein R1sor_003193 [Riccia sorocarpa]|uniref:Uncharacterized protein n=1 Tax=Riccia sorocarpa TaxID=122646 RepID=A0ABD3H326_9MARC
MEELVECARLRVQHDTSSEAKQSFEEAITNLRRREHEEAELCMRECKITWLKEGEAPTKYFFARLKAKNAQEAMTALELESGEVIEDQDEILGEVHRYYQALYKAEEESAATLAKREEVVNMIDKRMTEEDNVALEESFWDKKSLVGKDSMGIIKLIPKNDRKHLLRNWRPITLLTMTYKIVAKL